MTKVINMFNPEKRQIRCIKNQHDYLGNGEIIIEEELEVGKLYTMTRCSNESYGSMVFLEEIPSRWGYQAYLFEELEPHDEKIFKKKSQEWLISELKKADTGKYISAEELEERMKKKIKHENYNPSFEEGHNSGNYYWIMPVKVYNKSRINVNDFLELEPEISINAVYFDPLLTDIFTESLNSDLAANKHRVSTDKNPDGEFVTGFQWYLHPNFYSHEEMRFIIRQLTKLAENLRTNHMNDISKTQKARLNKKFNAVVKDENVDMYAVMLQTAEFYSRLALKLRKMMAFSDIICVIAP